jgi:hypothetical protein
MAYIEADGQISFLRNRPDRRAASSGKPKNAKGHTP